MRYDLAKSWPHPVLRPSRAGQGDYVRAEFQVEIEIDRADDATDAHMHAEFVLSADNLRDAIVAGNAANVLLVKCPATFFRQSFHTQEFEIDHLIEDGQLSGRTEMLGFIVATKRFSLPNGGQWHSDYTADAFDIEPGDVLAQDSPYRPVVDTAESANIGSIFEHVAVDGLDSGRWRCGLEFERLRLEMSPDDERALLAIREGENAPAGASAAVMNGVYLPALVYALHSADNADGQYAERRWFRALNARLADNNLPELGEGTDRADDAQALLKSPFGRLLASQAFSGTAVQ